MKKTLKENRVLLVLAVIIFISLILTVIGLLSYFYGNDKDKYGNRLDNIKDYPISDTIDSDIKSLYEAGVESIKVDVRGKIVYVIMDVSAGVSKVEAQGYADSALTKFSDEEKGYYDIQFLITCNKEEGEEKSYPIEGYKNSSSNVISWTNN